MPHATLTIGEVAGQAGLKTSAIRFYEQAGLLPKPLRQAGQRRYSEDIFNRLALLEYAKQSGFKLEEIRRLFYGSREGVPLSARWQQLATAKISELDRQMQQIAAMKRLLERILKCRCIDVDECGRSIRTSK
jgi:MerR family redox-sensitive transcriptional activator SoxR